jgi:hypothetical protein
MDHGINLSSVVTGRTNEVQRLNSMTEIILISNPIAIESTSFRAVSYGHIPYWRGFLMFLAELPLAQKPRRYSGDFGQSFVRAEIEPQIRWQRDLDRTGNRKRPME